MENGKSSGGMESVHGTSFFGLNSGDIQGVSGGRVNILGGGSMEYSE
jgi:hypothetical protein